VREHAAALAAAQQQQQAASPHRLADPSVAAGSSEPMATLPLATLDGSKELSTAQQQQQQ
jgi:hypothetical protein